MIYSLTGKVLEKSLDRVVIECAGVGYEVSVSASVAGALSPVGAVATLYTSLNLTENDVSLYGFSSAEARKMFLLLTGVSGVGPKAGLAILSVLTPDRITLAISAGDHKAFTAAQGVGPKLGQRIVLELKDKVAKGLAGSITLADLAAGPTAPAAGMGQAIAALAALGYTQSEAAEAVARLDASLSTEELIKQALRSMAGKVR